jgi:cytochrome c553
MRSLLLLVLGATTAFAQDGSAVYKAHCAVCHDSSTPRVPPSSALRKMSSAVILQSLEAGLMKAEAASLTSGERTAVSDYLGSQTPPFAASIPASAFCSAQKESSNALDPARWIGWGSNSANTRFVSA